MLQVSINYEWKDLNVNMEEMYHYYAAALFGKVVLV